MYAILIYGFPLTLLLFEWGLRVMLTVDSSGFTGPALAAAGLSFLMPLTKPKITELAGNTPKKMVMMSKADSVLIPIVWMFVFIFLFSWSFACYVSIKFPNDHTFGFNSHLVIGSLVYLASLILTGIKENVRWKIY